MVFLKNIIRNIFSRPIFQPFFELVLSISLKALNIGDGHTVETSGEMSVAKALRITKTTGQAVVFDVGAHIGEWYNLFSSKYRGDFVVYSFEPSSASYEQLIKIRNDKFIPEKIALGETNSTMHLESDTSGDSTAHVSSIIDGESVSFSEEIVVKTLDSYCQEHSINHIDLLKLDVEGYEIKVLKGASNMLKNGKIMIIQFEFGALAHERTSLKEFFDILSDQYEIYRILKNGYYKLKQYSHIHEINTLTNFMAVKKNVIV